MKNIRCSFCEKMFSKKGIGTHIWRKHGNGINHETNSNIGYKNGRVVWNKGLTKESSESIKNSSLTFKKNFLNGEINFKGRKLSKETIQKLKINSGGIRKGAGRGKKGWYKNYWCDSSWELAYVIYNLDHNIKFERNRKYFEYVYKNETHKYYPDFIEGNKYVEIKGYESIVTKLKKEAMKNENYELINASKIEKYLKYTIEKYGIDFIKLYKLSSTESH